MLSGKYGTQKYFGLCRDLFLNSEFFFIVILIIDFKQKQTVNRGSIL